jgi:ring-1,2-phenylacetyl-CoA epoxidase subunit PaaC
MLHPILFQYCLHLADNALILAQRNSEWCGHGPVLEQDIAITNISLDLLGQARNFYQLAADTYNSFSEKEKEEVENLVPRLWKIYGRGLNEDDLAFLREEQQYLNLQLLELPKGDWAQTVLRQFFYSTFQYNQYLHLQQSSNTQLSAIAEKSIKEVAYHLRWSSEWVVRLGDGTDESNRRIRNALDELWPFTGEMFMPASYELLADKEGIGVDVASLKEIWSQKVTEVFDAAKLQFPQSSKASSIPLNQNGGKQGCHTEYLGYLLTEMQYLQRVYPDNVW